MEKFKRKFNGKAGVPKSRLPRSSLSLQALASIDCMATSKMNSYEEDMEPLLERPNLPSSFTRPDLISDAMLASNKNTGPSLDTNSTPSSTPKQPDSTKGFSSSTSMWSFRNLKPKAGSAAEVDEDDPRLVRDAMPQQYWVGRFMGLNDRLRNETHQEQLKKISELEEDMYPTLFHEGPEAVNSANEEFTRSKRVFAELDKFCRTKEAHESLKAFQEAYAKKQKDDRLLPVIIEGGFLKRAGNTLAQISPKTMSAIFARSTSGSKSKKSSLGAEITREEPVDEEDTLINWKYKKVVPPSDEFKWKPTRIPTPTFSQSSRSPSAQYSSPTPVAANTIVNDMSQLGFDVKTPSDGTRAPPSSVATTPSTTPYKSSRPSGMSRDRSFKNFSSSYQPRRPSTTEVDPRQGFSRSNTASNMSGSKTTRPSLAPRPSLPREKSVGALDAKTSLNLPRNTSINNFSSAKTTENRRPIKTPSRNDPVRPLAVKLQNDVPAIPPIPKQHISSSRTPNTKPPRVSSVANIRSPARGQAHRASDMSSSRTPGRSQPHRASDISSSRTPSRQPHQVSDMSSRTPGRSQAHRASDMSSSRTPGRSQPHRNSDMSSSRTPGRQPPPSNYAYSSRTPDSRQSRSSDVYGHRTPVNEQSSSSNFSQNYGRTIHEEPSFANDSFPSNRTTLVNDDSFQSIYGFNVPSSEYGAKEMDRLGEPCWDSKGYPFYFFEGERLYVKYRAREASDGPDYIAGKDGSVVAKKVIIEDKHESWQRALTIGERQERLAQILRERYTDADVAAARARFEAQAKELAEAKAQATAKATTQANAQDTAQATTQATAQANAQATAQDTTQDQAEAQDQDQTEEVAGSNYNGGTSFL